jgi:hypothetical protein
MTLRESLETLRAGPALVAGLPGDEVDVERLIAHLVAYGFTGGVHLTDHETESLLWVHDGAPQDVWFFEAGGSEAALAGVLGHDLFHQMAARGGTVSVFVGHPPQPAAAPIADEPAAPAVEPLPQETSAPAPAAPPATPVAPPAAESRPTVERPAADVAVRAPEPRPTAEPVHTPPEAVRTSPEPARTSPEPVRTAAPPPVEVAAAAPRTEPAIPEPPSHPWAAILEDVAERVARHRGPKLAARFMTALESALAAQGGRLEGGRIVAPGLSESTWRIVVEAACAPITAIAGRAFVDRTIAAAEREVRALQFGGNPR